MNPPERLLLPRVEAVPAPDPMPPRFVYTPALDIRDTEEGLVLEADLPGVAPESLEIQVKNNTLEIYGRVTWPLPADARTLYEEVQPGDFYRSFILSEEYDNDNITADFNDGVLKLTLPKATMAKPRKIEVRTGRQSSSQGG
jgi:HSP20 family molecular chaperone IbpA